jgi:putative membrane protein
MRVKTLSAALTAFVLIGAAGRLRAADITTVPQSQAGKPLTAKEYVEKAAIADLFEVEAGKVALGASNEKGVKDFAEMMIRDHTDSTNKIKGAVAGNRDLAVPAKLDAEHEDMLRRLKNADKNGFDRLYLQMQLEGHEKALALHRGYAVGGDDASLRKVAADLTPVVQKHADHLAPLVAAK